MRVAGLATSAFVLLIGPGRADPLRDEIEQLRTSLHQEIAALKAREQQLDQQLLRLDQRNRLLDRQLRSLRGAGAVAPGLAGRTGGSGLPALASEGASNAPA